MTEPLLKKLTLREVARRFEQGDDGALEDYRVHNLHESTAHSSEALQETLRSMPVARNVIQDMLKVTKDLSGRVAGRNSDDAAQISAGLIHLLEHLHTYEASTAQAAKDLAKSPAIGTPPASPLDCKSALSTPNSRRESSDRIAELTQKCSVLERQCTELQLERNSQAAQIGARDASILALRQKLGTFKQSDSEYSLPSNGITNCRAKIAIHSDADDEAGQHSTLIGTTTTQKLSGMSSFAAPDRLGSQAMSSVLSGLSIGGRSALSLG